MLNGALRTAALLLVALLTACGGGGGGSGGGGGGPPVVVDDTTFTGTYFTMLKAGRQSPGPFARGSTGILTADGAGDASHTQTANDSGLVSDPTTTPYDYDVASDGTLELALAVSGTVFARGGIHAGGGAAVLGSVAPGAFPGILVLLRRQGLHDEASLSGPYHFVEYEFALSGGGSAATTGTATFDGLGGATTTATLNGMGAVVSGVVGAFTYSVIGDGTSTLMPAVAGAPVEEGGVVAGGAAALWCGSTTDGEAPVLTVVVREAAGAGLATFQGAYWIVLLERDPTTGAFRSLTGTATSDGAGALTLVGTSNTEGTLAAEPPGATTYTVSPIGRLTVDAGGSVLVGGVSQDGSFAVLAGGTAPGSRPTIAILVKK